MMKLSEAILLGSVGTEQAYGCNAIMPNARATCALGAALFAVNEHLKDWTEGAWRIVERWPWVKCCVPIPEILKECCAATGSYGSVQVFGLIWRLNDEARWTRPQIAAWVAELERTYDPDPVPVAVTDPVHESVPVQ